MLIINLSESYKKLTQKQGELFEFEKSHLSHFTTSDRPLDPSGIALP
jgi:hypothetical protein